MFSAQTISGQDDHEEAEHSQGAPLRSNSVPFDDDILAGYRESFEHPNRLRSMVLRYDEKNRHPRLHRHRIPRRAKMRSRYFRYRPKRKSYGGIPRSIPHRPSPVVMDLKRYPRIPSTRTLLRQALRNPMKPVKKITKPVGHIPIPYVLNLKGNLKKHYSWNPLRKREANYRMARINRRRAWSKRSKRR